MKERMFAELLEVEDMGRVRLSAGTRFLAGKQMIAQKDFKKAGQEISYYVVTYADEDGKNVSYKPVYDKLEE